MLGTTPGPTCGEGTRIALCGAVYVVCEFSRAIGVVVLLIRLHLRSGKMAKIVELDAILITMERNGMNLSQISQFKQMMAIDARVIIAEWIDVLRRQRLLKK